MTTALSVAIGPSLPAGTLLAEAGESDGPGPRAPGCLVLLEPLDFESLTQWLA